MFVYGCVCMCTYACVYVWAYIHACICVCLHGFTQYKWKWQKQARLQFYCIYSHIFHNIDGQRGNHIYQRTRNDCVIKVKMVSQIPETQCWKICYGIFSRFWYKHCTQHNSVRLTYSHMNSSFRHYLGSQCSTLLHYKDYAALLGKLTDDKPVKKFSNLYRTRILITVIFTLFSPCISI
jgi:hypothetical protein